MLIAKLRSQPVQTALDPLLSSGAVFLIQFAVLFTASKTEFAVFSLAYSYVIMGEVVLSSLFGAPLITLLGREHDDGRARTTGEGLLRIQLVMAAVLALVGTAVALALGIAAAIAMISGLCFFVLSFRDALRSTLVAGLRLKEALKIAVIFFAGCLIQLPVALLIGGEIDAFAGLCVMAVAAAIAVGRNIYLTLANAAPVSRSDVISLGGMASWSLPGALVIWLQNSFYLTIVAISIDLASVGEISASRMVIMPLLIVSSGLMRLLQVRAASHLRADEDGAARWLGLKISIAVLVTGVLLASLVFSASGRVDPQLLPDAYPNLVILIGGWLLFASATIARSAISSIYQAMGRYREIFLFNILTLPPILAGVVYAPDYFGLLGAILPMAIGEAVLLTILAVRLRR